jgi:hypothetical protein
MIPFFRKIRKKMADDNRPLQYMRYAVGEIVLVVVGILIALQINTWNNELIEKRKEQSVLIGLHETFSINLENLDYVMATSIAAFDSSKKLLSLMGPSASDYTSTEVDSLIGHMINYSTYDPSSGTIDDIINSGKLNIIRNPELKANISNWSGMLEDTKKDINIANNHSFNVLLIYLNDKVNLKNVPIPKYIIEKTQLNITEPSHFPSNYDVFMRAKEFENLVDFHALNINYLMREYLQIKDYLEVNVSLLEAEIQD